MQHLYFYVKWISIWLVWCTHTRFYLCCVISFQDVAVCPLVLSFPSSRSLYIFDLSFLSFLFCSSFSQTAAPHTIPHGTILSLHLSFQKLVCIGDIWSLYDSDTVSSVWIHMVSLWTDSKGCGRDVCLFMMEMIKKKPEHSIKKWRKKQKLRDKTTALMANVSITCDLSQFHVDIVVSLCSDQIIKDEEETFVYSWWTHTKSLKNRSYCIHKTKRKETHN